MKRIVCLLASLLVVAAVFADDDADRVLSEARRRADSSKSKPVGIFDQVADESGDAEEVEPDTSIYLPIALSILPGAPLPGLWVDATFGFGLIISSLDDIYGLQASSIGNNARGSVNGFQGAGVFNTADGAVHGFQGAGVFNVADGTVSGFQGAGVFNISGGNVGGFQGAGVFNIAKDRVVGAQMAGVFNILENGGGPVQGAGVFNISGGTFSGFQAAGVFNIAHDINGVQTAGVFNVAHKVTGLQIGIVNVADTAYGFQLGLVNIVLNGIKDTGVWAEDSGAVYLFSQRGSNLVYNLVYVGAPRDDWFTTDERLTAGFGIGLRLGSTKTWEPQLDIDVSAKALIHFNELYESLNLANYFKFDAFPNVRVSVRLPVALGLALHAGVSADIKIAGGPEVPAQFQEPDAFDLAGTDHGLTVHPKFFVGISL